MRLNCFKKQTKRALSMHGQVLADVTIQFEAFLVELSKIDNTELKKLDALPSFLTFILFNCSAIRDILCASGNAIAVTSLARAIQEAYIGLFYFCIEMVDPSERELRNMLWKEHVHGKHIELAFGISKEALTPDLKQLMDNHQAGFLQAKETLSNNSRIIEIRSKNKTLAGKLVNETNEYLSEYRSEIWNRAGLGNTFRNAWTFFSQNSHATPWMIDGLLRNQEVLKKEGSDFPVHAALVCIYKAVQFTVEIRPDLQLQARRVTILIESVIPPFHSD